MRNLFASKNHKKKKSLKLQQKLQSEEDRLWQEEQVRRRDQELRDEEIARNIQEELGRGQQQEQQPSPSESEKALAMRLQQEFERVNIVRRDSTRQSPVGPLNDDHVLSDEEYARRLQEEFNAEREDILMMSPVTPRPISTVSPIPPALPLKPIAYHNTEQLAASTPTFSGSSNPHPGRSVPDASRHHPITPPLHTSSTPSSSNIHSRPAPANNTDRNATRRDESRVSLSDERPLLFVKIPALYHAPHSPLTTATPHSTTTLTVFTPPTKPQSSQPYQRMNRPSLVRETNITPSPLPNTIPSTSPVSQAQFHSLQPRNSYPLPEHGTHLSQQHHVLSNISSQPTPSGQRPQHEQQHAAPTAGARLFSRHLDDKNADAVTTVAQTIQHDEDESTRQQRSPPKFHQERSDIPNSMSMREPPTVSRIGWETPSPLNTYISPTAGPQADLAELPPSHPRASLSSDNTNVAFQMKNAPPKHRGTTAPPVGIPRTGHKPNEISQDTTTRYSHYGHSDSDDDNFSEDFVVRRQDTPVKEKNAADKGNDTTCSSAELNPFADSYAVESVQPSDDESRQDVLARSVSSGTKPPDGLPSASTMSSWAVHPAFNSVSYLDDGDLVNMDTADSESSDVNGSSDDGSIVTVSSIRRSEVRIGVTVGIQTDPAEEISSSTSAMNNKVPNKSAQDQQSNRSIATRVDPTFGITLSPPAKRPGSVPLQSAGDELLSLGLPTPSISDMQIRLDELLVDVSTDDVICDKVDKVQSTQEPQISDIQGAWPGLSRQEYHHSYSVTPLMSNPGINQLHQQGLYPAGPQRAVAPTTYYDTSYAPMHPEYRHSLQHWPGMYTPGPTPEPVYTGEVPSNEYGYYHVGNRPEQGELSSPNNLNSATEKALPKIPRSNPNDRRITIPSTDPSIWLWIQVHPTDRGKDLAERIHIVATRRTRKILSIKTTQGRDVPLDSTPVFNDWSEIEELADGAPWKVEWGPLDDPFSGGRELVKHIASTFRAAVMD